MECSEPPAIPDRAYEPGDPVTWHVPMADLDRSQYRTWGERWDTFLNEGVGPVVTPIATALPLAIPTIARLGAPWADRGAQAVSLPYRMQQEYGGDLYAAGHDPRLAAEGLTVAGMLTLGGLARPGISGAPDGVSIASRSANLYDPPVFTLRPFEADYPNGANADDAGRLLFDLDGQPIHPDATIVGRGVVGVPDEALGDSAIDALGAQIIGRHIAYPPRSRIVSDSALGEFAPEFDELGNFTGRGVIGVAGDSPANQLPFLAAHEVSHAIDHRSAPAASGADFNARRWGINPPDPDMDIEVELHKIYSDLNNAPGARTTINGPADLGYSPADTPRELWAEAIRAYMADPNYIKTVAPRVAQAIRDHVNTHPELSRIVHFNAGGLPIPIAPIPDTLQGVTLPGGAPVASLGDLMAMGPTPTIRPPLGPQWAADHHANYQDASTPQYAARLAQEQAGRAARLEAEAARREAEEWERAYREGRAF